MRSGSRSRKQPADYNASSPFGLISRHIRRLPPVDADLLAAELDTHRRYLLRVAQLQLRDADLAEDVVQETLVAAFSARDGFSGRSSVKTWLTGILKHKIVDAIRQKQRQPIILATFEEETDLEDFDPMFKDSGAWEAPPADWGDPENARSRQCGQGRLGNSRPKSARHISSVVLRPSCTL